MKNLIILKGKKVVFSFIAIFLVTSAALAEDSIIKIGVLAKRGPERCIEKWSPTAEYLSNKIPEKTFVIVPVDYDRIYSVVEKSEVDFILANSSFYVELESWYKVNRIATLKNKVSGEISTAFGGVVFCKKQRKDIRQYSDLKGKTVMAVKETSFGGWRMAWRELKEALIDPFKDFASLNFGGTHDAVVYAVRDGKVDAGIVRTDALERMNAEGKIRLDDFYVIHEHGGENVHLPFLHSTREYPEWPIAKLKHTSNEVAEKVAVALIGMPQDSAAAQAAGCAGWTIPLNYQSVHDCLKELKVGPYKDLGKITLTDIFRKYRILILIDLATLVVLAWFLATHIILNRKIRTAHKELELEVNERIEAEETLRKSEERYRRIFENIQDVYYETSMDGTILEVSPSIENVSAYKRKELIGKSLYDIYTNPAERDELLKAILDSGKVANFEVHLTDKDGSQHSVELNTTLDRDQKGNSIKLIGSMRDISERKRLEARLQQAQKMEAIGSLAGGIAHEFNNILGVIIGNTEMVIGDVPESNPARDCLKEIQAASLRAKDVVRQILGFARKSVFQLMPVQISPIISETLKLIRASTPATIEIRRDLSCESDTVMADPTQVNQVLINLCTNAKNAMQEKGGVLEVKLEDTILDEKSALRYEDLSPGNYVKLTVKDSGHGIDPKIIDRIFDPYFTTTSLAESKGMGLAVVHGIVKRHNGAIIVASEPGKGTVFEVLFPLTEAEAEQEAGEPEALPTGAERILFVDDEESLVKMGQKMLDQLGYSVETKRNPIEALELVRSEPDRFDLIITDMTMPQMTGDKLAKEILSIRPDMPIILCTGFSEKIDAEKARALGIRKYIEKPPDMSDFVAAVRKLLVGAKRRSR